MGRRDAVREVVAVGGVVLGLVFVGYETRQNTAALRSQALQTTAEMSRQHTVLGVELPELRDAWDIAITQDAPEAMTPDQRRIMSFWTHGAMRIVEHRYHQLALGTLPEALTLGGRGGHYQSRYFRDWWSGRKQGFPPGFAAWVEEEVLEHPAR